MTTEVLMMGRGPGRPGSALTCQRVGGCSAKTTLTAILVGALLVAASLICVWSRTQVVQQGYALSEATGQLKDLKAENERLRMAAMQLRAPERIEELAREQGMTFPESSQVRVVEIAETERNMVAALAGSKVK